MNLLSIEFAAFVALAAILIHASPPRIRPTLLCGMSLIFCALNSIAAAVALVLASALAFYAARSIDQTADARRRQILLAASITGLVAHLFVIKLIPDLNSTAGRSLATQMLGAFGASYYTLKLVGYLVDVFWRRYPAWTSPADFLEFSAFFPLLPAGPIQRANEFNLDTRDSNLAALMAYGLRRILFGLVKKLLVADRLGALVDYIAGGQPDHANVLWVMTYLFPLQLYADFSALTDIGIGIAAIFGVRPPENFAFPFFATSISEFWRRWHMSLTRWLVDYVFLPLRMATRRLGNVGLVISISANMALIGMWHAISFGWLLFGLMNASFLIADVFTTRWRRRVYKRRPLVAWGAAAIGPVLVYHMIAFSLVCFRAQSLADIAYYFGHLLDGVSAPIAGLKELFYSYGRAQCAYDFAALCGFSLIDGALYLRSLGWAPMAALPRFIELPRAIRWAGYYLALLAVGIAGQQSSRFIYVQF